MYYLYASSIKALLINLNQVFYKKNYPEIDVGDKFLVLGNVDWFY